jgi:hypothetical protein
MVRVIFTISVITDPIWVRVNLNSIGLNVQAHVLTCIASWFTLAQLYPVLISGSRIIQEADVQNCKLPV